MWEFWIDVGGTFTDCFAVDPQGQLQRAKLLSSGVTKLRAQIVGTQSFADPRRIGEPANFWRGYTLRRVDDEGQTLSEARVVASDPRAGLLQTDAPLVAESAVGGMLDGELFGDEEAPILAIRRFIGLRRDEPLPGVRVRLGTTRGTNALLTRSGARAAWVTTRGFGDILDIGYQDRPRLFELGIHKDVPLYAARAEIDERIAADGSVLYPLDIEQARGELLRLKREGVEALAICLMHAYINDQHERQLAELARSMGFAEVSVSSEIAPLIKLVARGDTALLNAYLNPVLQRYLGRIRASLGPQSQLRVLSSAGGLVSADRFQGKDSILSGPAGGVVGFARAAERAGFAQAIGFDMGGTSTDVSRYDGRFELQYETKKAGVRLVTPTMAIETVAAGGGSICDFDGVKLVVGPSSAGADPGPACYGRGGPLTVTDLNLLLGRLVTAHFPFPLRRSAAERQLAELTRRVNNATGHAYTPDQLAAGLLEIANTSMAQAIRSISVAKGYDPRQYVLAAFGGAAAQHACAVAEQLEMSRILIHPDASLLSAYGIGMADVTVHRAQGLYQPLADAEPQLPGVFEQLAMAAQEELIGQGATPTSITIHRILDLRFQGQDAFLSIDGGEDASSEVNWASRFVREHERLYGFVLAGRSVEVVAARIEARSRSQAYDGPATASPAAAHFAAFDAVEHQPAYFGGQWVQVPVREFAAIPIGSRIDGPLLVVEPNSTIAVAPGWSAERLAGGELVLTRHAAQRASRPAATADVAPDPVTLEIFHHAFAGIAEQMGIALRNSSSSVNVKERLDFSCAVFTAAGDLVANAPHIPVHLGAMSETVKSIIKAFPKMYPGDVFVTNDPYAGGSHLPDVTVVSPVFIPSSGAGERPVLFTASRAHHAEIGGIVPGSMPPASRNLSEEGVLISNFALVRHGREHWDELRHVLSSGMYPSRSVETNLADIRAQVAANRQGARDLEQLAHRFGLEQVLAYTGHIQKAAERKMRAALARRPDGVYARTDYLDDGTPITVAITINGDSAVFDFQGTGPVVPGNLNANRAIVSAAIMYCLRCLLDEDIPLNQGVLAPIEIRLPECLLNPPRGATPETCAAVAGGNVETSQRVVDVILGALGAAAASQGTMNNLSFGNREFGYYETICGGEGATPERPGASAVHTHMTNTRLTDPEVFEHRFPVRLERFAIRRGSGGSGRYRGGDGVVREITFLAPLDVAVVSQRRGPYPPFGLDGGQPGAFGVNALMRAEGQIEQLGAIAQTKVAPGDRIMIATPGGGGVGRA